GSGPEVRVLQISRKLVVPRRGDRQSLMEELHDRRGTAGGAKEQTGSSALGAVGRGCLVFTNGRPQAPYGLCDHRRQLFRSPGGVFGLFSGIRFSDRKAGVVASDDQR